MENHHSSAAPPNAKGSSAGSAENKDVAVPNLSSSAEVAAIVAASNNDVSKGKSVAADDDKELKPHIVAEQNRQNLMKDYFGELQALMPQIPEKSDNATIVGHAINYIKSLEKTNALLEKQKQELELAWQAAAEDVASSSSAPLPPLTAQEMAMVARSSDVADACSIAPPLQPAMPVPAPQLLPAPMSSDVPQPLLQPLDVAEPAPAPAQLRIITARRVGFQTWTWPNVVLRVSNDTAYIKVLAPRYRGMWTKVMVLSVLNRYGIEVVTGQIDSDAVRSVFKIHARVTAMGGENRSTALELYQLAVSEILVWLTTN